MLCIIIILVMIMPVTTNRNGVACVVDSGGNGSRLNSTCGDETQPCTSLQECLEGSKQYSKVKVRGSLFLTGDSINISNNVGIVGEKGAMIIGNGATVLFNVIGGNKIEITIVTVRFYGIGVANIETKKDVDVSLVNCTSVGLNRSLVLLNPDVNRVSVRLANSSFIDIDGYVLHFKIGSIQSAENFLISVLITNSIFVRSKGVSLQNNFSAMNITIHDSVFKYGVPPLLNVQGKRMSTSIKITNCVFQNIFSNDYPHQKEGVVNISGIERLIISQSTFFNNSASYGSLFIIGINTIVINNCTFYSNSAWRVERGGTVSIYNSSRVHIGASVFENNYAVSGGMIYLQNINMIDISGYNVFKDGKSKKYGGCIYAKDCNNFIVNENNLFDSCQSGVSGGAMFLSKINTITINGKNKFNNCNSKQKGGFLYAGKCNSLQIDESNFFESCRSGRGGAVYLWKLNMMIFSGNNIFKSCKSKLYGGCMYLNNCNSFLIDGKNLFDNCSSGRDGGIIYLFKVKATKISRSNIFKNSKSNQYGGCLRADDCNSLQIDEGNSFENCSSGRSGGIIYLFKVKATKIRKSNMFKNSMSNQDGGCLFAYDCNSYQIDEDNSFESCSSGRLGGILYLWKVNVTKISENNVFKNSKSNRGGGCLFARDCNKLLIHENNFFDNCYSGKQGGAIYLQTIIIIIIKNCSLINNTALVGGAMLTYKVNIIKILYCRFLRNWAGYRGGAVMVVSKANIEITFSYFDDNRAKKSGGSISVINYKKTPGDHSSFLTDCIFKKSQAKYGGALHFLYHFGAESYQYEIKNSLFVNCSATVLGQSVYTNEHMKLRNILILSHEKRNIYHIYGESGKFDVRNITINLLRHEGYTRVNSKSSGVFLSSAGITIQGGLNLTCPVGFNPVTVNSTYLPIMETKKQSNQGPVLTYLTLQCQSCPYNYYALSRGRFFIETFITNGQGIYNSPFIEHHDCFKCPEGGNCDIDVRAQDNHYGFIGRDMKINFQICPTGYCCTKETIMCVNYDTCSHGRAGILCGSCQDGYKQSFLTLKCILKGEQCNLPWFLLYLGIFSIAYTAMFIIITNIGDIINQLKLLLSKGNENDGDQGSFQDIKVVVPQRKSSGEGFSIAAFVQVVVLYYQVASMLRVKYQKQKLDQREESSTDTIREFISKLFNFRFVLYQGVCPSDELNLPQKEAILFGMKLMTFFILILLISICTIARYTCTKMHCKDKPIKNSKIESVEIPLNSLTLHPNATPSQFEERIDFGHRLKLTYIKLLKLYFTPCTQSALKMVHCVRLGESYHLFVYGDMTCYNKWQLAVITIILPGVLLFPVCFELSLRLLKKGLLSSTNFIAALACPYYGVMLYANKNSQGNEHNIAARASDEQEFARRVLESEEELFVPDENSLRWQVVQLYRTIIINVVVIFITIPFYRLLALSPLLIVFFIHDRYRMPYKHEFLNQLQSLSSVCLLLVLLSNTLSSISFMADISSVEFVDLVVNVCAIVEITLYVAVPLYLPIYKASKLYTNRKHKKDK